MAQINLTDPSFEPTDVQLNDLMIRSRKSHAELQAARQAQAKLERDARITVLIAENIKRGRQLRVKLVERGVIKAL